MYTDVIIHDQHIPCFLATAGSVFSRVAGSIGGALGDPAEEIHQLLGAVTGAEVLLNPLVEFGKFGNLGIWELGRTGNWRLQ